MRDGKVVVASLLRAFTIAAILFALSGCLRFKDTGDVRTSIMKSEVVDASVKVIADRGVTANLTPDRARCSWSFTGGIKGKYPRRPRSPSRMPT